MKYYSTQRPIMPGCYPSGAKITAIMNFDNREYVEEIGRQAWGYLETDEPLNDRQIYDYELVATEDEED